MEEEVKAPLPEDTPPEPRLFNADAREAMEKAYTEFEAAEQPAAEEPAPTPVTETPVAETTTIPKETVIEEAPATTPSLKYKTHEEAEVAYKEAERRMHEATQEAARLRKENEDFIRRMQTQPHTPVTEPVAPAPPALDKESLEAEFFKDPIGFQLAMNEAMARHAIEQAEAKITEKTRAQRVKMTQQAMTNKLQEHFDTTYPELKVVEPLALDYTEQVRNDREFMTPLLQSIESAPPDLKARKIFEVSRAVMDEGAKRLKTRLPEIGAALGLSPSGAQTSKERLHTGAPPIVPGGSNRPVVTPSAATAGESNEEYLQGRLKRQDRMRASTWVAGR